MAFDDLHSKEIFSQIGEDWSSRNKKTVCEALWEHCSECNPVQDIQVIQKENALAPYFQELSWEAGNSLFILIAELCSAYQRSAFLDGLRFAFCMHNELKS